MSTEALREYLAATDGAGAILRVPCPDCGQPAGLGCVNRANRTSQPHNGRWRAERDAFVESIGFYPLGRSVDA